MKFFLTYCTTLVQQLSALLRAKIVHHLALRERWGIVVPPLETTTTKVFGQVVHFLKNFYHLGETKLVVVVKG